MTTTHKPGFWTHASVGLVILAGANVATAQPHARWHRRGHGCHHRHGQSRWESSVRERNYPVVMALHLNAIGRSLPVGNGQVPSIGGSIGISAGGQFVLRPRWRLLVRGGVEIPRVAVGASDTADGLFTYVLNVDTVVRYRLGERSSAYLAVGAGAQLIVTSVECQWGCGAPGTRYTTVGGAALAIGEVGRRFGWAQSWDIGLRLRAGMPVNQLGMVLDLGAYLGKQF